LTLPDIPHSMYQMYCHNNRLIILPDNITCNIEDATFDGYNSCNDKCEHLYYYFRRISKKFENKSKIRIMKRCSIFKDELLYITSEL
jgi:hypothetical protein